MHQTIIQHKKNRSINIFKRASYIIISYRYLSLKYIQIYITKSKQNTIQIKSKNNNNLIIIKVETFL